MPDPEHLKILKQGVKVWNKWRDENPEIKPDLTDADLSMANLGGADLTDADLEAADLGGADLGGADLSRADLSMADLSGGDLSRADLSYANLFRADLYGAKLSSADLSGANVSKAKFDFAKIIWTKFGNIDLSNASGLKTIEHFGPSTIGIDTILRSGGKIPHKFLEGAGVPAPFIEYMGSLTGQAFQFGLCFISYSNQDEGFAKRLHANLRDNSVRCWFAPKDIQIGAEIRTAIEEEIRLKDKVLLVLSENSINSEWVKDNVEAAFEEENRRKKTILFPIRIDEAVMETDQAWAAKLRRQRHIDDFTNWKDHDSYQDALKRLLKDLQAGE